MHLEKFTEEQACQNQKPKHWWQRKSPWYARAFMIVMSIFGASLAIYLPLSYLTAPAELKNTAGMLSVVVVGGFTFIGVFMAKFGISLFEYSFVRRRNQSMDISHGEAILVGIVIAALSVSFFDAIEGKLDKARQLNAETQILQAKIKALESGN